MTNTPKLAIAIGYIDDDLVTEAVEYMPTHKNNKIAWFRYAIVAACLCLVVIGVLKWFPYMNQTDDPNWSKTHFQTANLDEIEAICGTNLLLDQLSMPGEYHSEYILEIAENGIFSNAPDWNNLSVSLSNGDSINDQTSGDYIYCFISFNGDTSAIDTSLWTGQSSMEMNGYSVRYNEKTTADYTAEGITLGYTQDYHGYAVFDHAGYTYYLSTHSDDPDFFDETLKNKLIYGSTHNPNADNSEHAITGPGKPLD